MNAALRALTRVAVSHRLEVVGVRRGFAGLLEGDFMALGPRSVGGVIHLAGTLLGTARCPQFHEAARVRDAADLLSRSAIDALVVIGGNGTQAGALSLSALGVPVVGIPSTIDNDLVGTDVTLGVDTALNTALEAVDRLRVTADSHRRGFLIEVMGRRCGYLALMTGLAGGAELVVVPEVEVTLEQIERALAQVHERGKTHALVVVAEGCTHNAGAILARLQARPGPIGFEMRSTVLGHVQRGGTPTLADRLLGTRLGAAAVASLLDGETGVLVGQQCGAIRRTPLTEIVGRPKPLDPELLALAELLER
jgi:6-phosphofructokinase 1